MLEVDAVIVEGAGLRAREAEVCSLSPEKVKPGQQQGKPRVPASGLSRRDHAGWAKLVHF